MRFTTKIRLISLGTALLPLIVATLIVTLLARAELFSQAEAKLSAVREIKQRQIAAMFGDFAAGLQTISAVVKADLEPHQPLALHDPLQAIGQALGFYDVFVIDPAGVVIYSASREADFQTNLINGPYASSNLAKVFQRASAQSELPVLEDFQPYAPSKGEPAAFMAKSLELGNQQYVVAVQLSIDKINAVMQVREGMGQTGESYLVGPDLRMRSDSYLDPKNRTVRASFAGAVNSHGVDTAASKAALQGQSGLRYIDDYNGNPVVSAFAPVDVYGLQWALLAEVDVAEIATPAQRMLWIGLAVIALAIGAAVLVARLVTGFVLNPLGGEPAEMVHLTSVIAKGDLTMSL